MITPDPNDGSKSILNFKEYFSNINIPDNWDNVEDFFNWFILEARMPIMIPNNAEVMQTEDSTAISLFRKGPYQVELIHKRPSIATKNHCHPNVESITLNLGGGRSDNDTHSHGAISWRLPIGSMHSELRTNPDNALGSYSLLSFQRWVDMPVGSILTNWKGITSGPLHEELIQSHYPSKLVQSGYADITANTNAYDSLVTEEIFLREHYFVVFHPGASGNFLSSLIRNIVSTQQDNVNIASSGSCHSMLPEVQKEIEYFSCGVFLAQQTKIKPYSFENRVKFYKKRLLSYDGKVPGSVVSWTHDFTNIPVYRKLFPNSKILVITQESASEKMCVTILQQLKNILSEDVQGILSENARNQHTAVWEEDCREILLAMVGTDYALLINEMLADRFNPEYKDILIYVSVYRRLRQANMLGILDDTHTVDTMNYNSYYSGPNDSPKNKYILAGPYKDYVDDACVQLPYESLMNKDMSTIIDTLTALLGTLTEEQKEYIKLEVSRYVDSQPAIVLDDPIGYIKSLKDSIIQQMSEMLDKYI